MSGLRDLERDGLLSCESPLGIEETGEFKRERIAFCASVICCREAFHGRASSIAGSRTRKPSAKPNKTYCPDCGHALIWAVTKKRKKNNG